MVHRSLRRAVLPAFAILVGGCVVAPPDREETGHGAEALMFGVTPSIPLADGLRWDRTWVRPGLRWVDTASAPPAMLTMGVNDLHVFTPVNGGRALTRTRCAKIGCWDYEAWGVLPYGERLASWVAPAAVKVGGDVEVFFVSDDYGLGSMRRTPSGWIMQDENFVRTRYHAQGVAGVSAVSSSTTRVNPLRPGVPLTRTRVDLFVLRIGGVLEQWTRTDDGAWMQSSIAAGVTSAPSATSWGEGRIDLVFRVGNDRVEHWSSNGAAWTPRASIVIDAASAPVIGNRGPNKLDLFVQRADGWLVHATGDGTTWKNLGATSARVVQCTKENPILTTIGPTSDPALRVRSMPPAVGTVGPDDLLLQVIGTDDRPYQKQLRVGSYGAPASVLEPPCAPCSTLGAACCSGSCGGGFVCVADRCTTCGREGASCCSYGCDAGLVCAASKCEKPCGDLGQACCGGTTCKGTLVCNAGSCASLPPPDFATEIYPLLIRCGQCHVGDAWKPFFVGYADGATEAQKSDAIAKTKKNLVDMGLVVYGSSATSSLYLRVTSTTAPMPPKYGAPPAAPLDAAEIALVKAWIDRSK